MKIVSNISVKWNTSIISSKKEKRKEHKLYLFDIISSTLNLRCMVSEENGSLLKKLKHIPKRKINIKSDEQKGNYNIFWRRG
jgi:hypothetical protein